MTNDQVRAAESRIDHIEAAIKCADHLSALLATDDKVMETVSMILVDALESFTNALNALGGQSALAEVDEDLELSAAVRRSIDSVTSIVMLCAMNPRTLTHADVRRDGKIATRAAILGAALRLPPMPVHGDDPDAARVMCRAVVDAAQAHKAFCEETLEKASESVTDEVGAIMATMFNKRH